jgi:hypothetical protein
LGNAARFAGDYIRLSDVVEKGRFAVVDMTHDHNDRLTPRCGAFSLTILLWSFGRHLD